MDPPPPPPQPPPEKMNPAVPLSMVTVAAAVAFMSTTRRQDHGPVKGRTIKRDRTFRMFDE